MFPLITVVVLTTNLVEELSLYRCDMAYPVINSKAIRLEDNMVVTPSHLMVIKVTI